MANVVGTSQCVLPSPIRMVSSTVMPTLDHTTAHILTFLERLHNMFIPPECMNDADHQRNRYVVVWDNAMEEACDEIDVGAIQGWIRYSRRFFPQCLAREDIACDVDEALWPDPAVRQDAA
ncbi:hypothetical protein SRHO_G00243490 [Serrasalmus rhombeus]